MVRLFKIIDSESHTCFGEDKEEALQNYLRYWKKQFGEDIDEPATLANVEEIHEKKKVCVCFDGQDVELTAFEWCALYINQEREINYTTTSTNKDISISITLTGEIWDTVIESIQDGFLSSTVY